MDPVIYIQLTESPIDVKGDGKRSNGMQKRSLGLAEAVVTVTKDAIRIFLNQEITVEHPFHRGSYRFVAFSSIFFLKSDKLSTNLL